MSLVDKRNNSRYREVSKRARYPELLDYEIVVWVIVY
jgi:hypothetical protein